ncbi:PEP-CTERM sorting domain-containing protein [Massilia oculi]|uniref:PEP-CTERM sorting domain-containing protein n=1 Tax=Massilia oculi TaxID=945844 RepID=UPI001AAEBA73|nr:PEP-CTERM sorting domain-containing protein [Massilia oculi]
MCNKAIGLFDIPLELMSVVNLYDARVSFLDSNNKLLIESDNLAGDVYQNNPWDGFFPATDDAFGTEGVGGLGVQGINFDFYVSEQVNAVPEPAGILLSGLGLMAMLTTRRRRQR